MVRTAPALHQRLVLDPTIDPVSRRIVAAVIQGIQNGSLMDGDPLPSSRRFAQEHGFSRSAVVAAYETLGGMGVIHSAHGSGTRVSPGAGELLQDLPASPGQAPHRKPHSRQPVLNLTVPGGAEKSVINVRDWNRAWREATDPYEEQDGSAILGEALNDHLRSFRGMVFRPDQIVLRPSIGGAIGDIVHGLGIRGQSVAIEDPGYPRIQRHFINEGCRVHCIPVDEQGLRIDMLTGADKVVHVTPARQWPTGVAMSEARREELLAWSARTGGVIVENDLDAEFTYGHAPMPTLFSMAGDGTRVIYLGSSSKLITPELGVVWMVVDDDFRRRAVDVAAVSDFSARALAYYMSSGAMYRHRNRALALFGERRAALLTALSRWAPAVRVFGDPSGTELVVRLPDEADELVLQMRLEDAGYRVSTLGDFAMRNHPPALLLQYGDLTPTQARSFAKILGSALQSPGGAREMLTQTPHPSETHHWDSDH